MGNKVHKLDPLVDDAALLGVFVQTGRREMVGAPPSRSPTSVPSSRTHAAPAVPSALPVQDPQQLRLEAELRSAREQVGTLTVQLQAAQAEIAGHGDLRAEVAARTAELDAARREADRRQTALLERAKSAEQRLTAADTRQLWLERGLLTTELHAAFSGLAQSHPSDLWQAMSATDPLALRKLLRDRLLLLCQAPACRPPHDTAVFHVPPERCELCGGSDLLSAFRVFAAAVHGAGFDAVTFVGGSPAYREKLRLLHREIGARFVIDVVQTKRPGESKRAQAKRGLIVIWGGSEVDHDTTIHYGESGDLVARLSHRGLSGLLPKATAFVREHPIRAKGPGQ